MDTKNFDNWCDMWNKAQEDGEFIDGCKEADAPNTEKVDFFGQNHEEGEEEIEQSNSDYWNTIYKMSNNSGDAPDVTNYQVLTENEEVPRPIKSNLTDKEIGDIVRSNANSANPIHASSVGKDQDYKAGINVYQLEQLSSMKSNLHELESKLNTNDALGKTKAGNKIQLKIDEMKKKIDELSDALTPNFLQSYLS